MKKGSGRPLNGFYLRQQVNKKTTVIISQNVFAFINETVG